MAQSTSSARIQEELEALRRELSQAPIVEEVRAAAAEAKSEAKSEASNATSGARTEIEKVLGELQERMSGAADEAEEMIAAHPFASVAAAFLLGVLVANFMSRGK